MSDIPTELKYTESHEWVRIDEDDNTVTVGITEHAQKALGDLVFVDLPEVESDVATGDECGVVESVKAASDIYSPITGEVVAVNEKLLEKPELVNQDPYGDGWIMRLRPANFDDLDDLMTAEAYEEKLNEESED
jgi:glycine cleavage system H protein